MKMIYPAVFYPYSDGSGGYVVEFPDLPGCVTGGKNLQEAIEMATDAASGWVLDELEEGNPVPKASEYHEVIPKRKWSSQYDFIGYGLICGEIWRKGSEEKCHNSSLA